jgi:hypothetical protein
MDDGYRVIDPRDWRLWAVAVPAIVVMGVLVWALGSVVRDHVAELQSVALRDPESATRRAAASLRTVLAVSVGGAFLVAAYLAWLGVRVWRSGRLPPPGSWIVTGRPVYSGRFAAPIGRLFIALALVLVAVAIGLLWMGWRLTAVQ